MYQGKKILSIVIARAGSKGIKLKNVRPLLGQPLFMWSVDASLQSKYIDYTVISSNCEHVKKVYEEFISDYNFLRREDEPDISDKVVWVQRPEEFSTSTSKNEDAMIHAVEVLKEQGKEFDSVVTLQPTSPVRNDRLIDKSIKSYYDGKYDSLVSGKKDTPFLWRKVRGKWIYDIDKNHCCNRKMRQAFIDNKDYSEFIFHDDGNLYQSNIEMLLKTKCRLGDKTCFYETDKLQSLQIDEEIDFQLIENIVNLKGMDSLI
jgi:CMP-N,N'-diacetyllegionaminic acid synthase